MSIEDEVREASQRFYVALNRMANGDSSLLSEIWSHDADVTAMHPIGGRTVGWDAVRSSFEQVAKIATEGKIDLEEQSIRVLGDVAVELGVEKGQLKVAGQLATLEHRVTNVYQRQAGAWRMVHHHTDLSPAMLDILGRL